MPRTPDPHDDYISICSESSFDSWTPTLGELFDDLLRTCYSTFAQHGSTFGAERRTSTLLLRSFDDTLVPAIEAYIGTLAEQLRQLELSTAMLRAEYATKAAEQREAATHLARVLGLSGGTPLPTPDLVEGGTAPDARRAAQAQQRAERAHRWAVDATRFHAQTGELMLSVGACLEEDLRQLRGLRRLAFLVSRLLAACEEVLHACAARPWLVGFFARRVVAEGRAALFDGLEADTERFQHMQVEDGRERGLEDLREQGARVMDALIFYERDTERYRRGAGGR
jgi:hypothetical protein